jgi:thiamine biosynthesis lipoprotein
LKFPQVIAEFEAIGTRWWVGSYQPVSARNAAGLSSQIQHLAGVFDEAYSRFKAESYVGRLNSSGKLMDFPDELYDMLQYAEKLCRISGGIFNVGVATALEGLGYGPGYEFEEKEHVGTLKGSIFDVLKPERIETLANAKVDLGGLGKGWLIDKMVELIKAGGLQSFYVNGGGDIAVHSPDHPRVFALESPFAAGESIGEASLKTGALAASAPNKRRWVSPTSGQKYHHLINLESGRPHDGPAAVHTYAPTATLADAASTILYLAPPPKFADLAKVLEVEYLLVLPDGSAVHSPQFPARLYA